jgi:phosphatidylserine/phosphatidylglycerophosphate/cardiolipin synthase-like enzyme
MRTRAAFALAALLCPALAAAEPPAVPAQVSASFTPAEHCLPQIVATIKGARQQIRVQAYGFSPRQIIAALVRAKRRGVDVQVILDRSDLDGAGLAAMVRAAVPVWIDEAPAIAHNKAKMRS